MEASIPQGSVTLWVCKEVCCWFPPKIIDLFLFFAFWYDIITDILLAIKFKEYCHPAYCFTSIAIMCSSIVISIGINADFSSKPIWTRIFSSLDSREAFIDCCKGILNGILFPFHLIYLSFKMLIHGNEEMTEQKEVTPFFNQIL